MGRPTKEKNGDKSEKKHPRGKKVKRGPRGGRVKRRVGVVFPASRKKKGTPTSQENSYQRGDVVSGTSRGEKCGEGAYDKRGVTTGLRTADRTRRNVKGGGLEGD